MSSAATVESSRHPWLGAVNVVLALTLLFMVFVALPTRWMPVDLGASLVALALVVCGVGLFNGTDWGEKFGRAVAMLLLIAGCSVATLLAVTAGELAGLYGPVGAGGALILFAVTLVVVPYFVLFPAFQFWFLSGPAANAGASEKTLVAPSVTLVAPSVAGASESE